MWVRQECSSVAQQLMWCGRHETPQVIAFDNIMTDIAALHPVPYHITSNQIIIDTMISISDHQINMMIGIYKNNY